MIKPNDSFCDDVEMYSLGGLDAEATQQFEHHLSHCQQCREMVEELQPLISQFPLAVESVEPPAGMKQRILAAVLQSAPTPVPMSTLTAADESIRPERQESSDNQASSPIDSNSENKADSEKSAHRPGVVPLRAAAGEAGAADKRPSPSQTEQRTAALQAQLRKRWVARLVTGVAASLVILSGFLLQQVNQLSNETADLTSQLEQLKQQIAASDSPAAASQVNGVVSLKPAEAGIVAEGRATISVDSKGMHLIVQVEQLPKLQGDEAFQVWLLKEGKPVNAGTFLPNEGVGALYFTFNPDDYDQIAITQEPDANGVEPRGSMVLAGALSQSEKSSS
ncbi:anti-sigma factor [Paenibacillus sp. FSL H8-0537]|uniref:anti-sigma factor domain-containing protein n=1 Tax=Paenibacillus sp. FSL H8-0537 TaxID=2921399 RepID=UPI003100E25C